MSGVYAIHRRLFLQNIRIARARLKADPASRILKRQLREAQKAAKRFREECGR